jgi:hypothetical protein
MARHLDEMQSYIRIAEGIEPTEEEIVVPDDLNLPAIDQYGRLLEDVKAIVFKLKSYRELNEDQNYALGIEEGLSLAAEMLIRLIEKQYQADF